MKIPAIIIEDELNAQAILTSIVNDYCPNVQIKGAASDVEGAIQLIKTIQPKLVFLDINLGEESGFSVLDQFLLRPFKVIITSAYQEHALEAFKYGAKDYLLKPYSPIQVAAAVERISKIQERDTAFLKLESLIRQSMSNRKISLPTNDGIDIFKVDEIIRVEADRAYCNVCLVGGVRKMISKALKEIQVVLPSQFYRVHSSHLINLNKLDKYTKDDGGYAMLCDGSKVPIARRRKVEFLDLIQQDRWNVDWRSV